VHIIRHNEFVGGQCPEKRPGRPRLEYLKPVVKNKGGESYKAVKGMSCNDSK